MESKCSQMFEKDVWVSVLYERGEDVKETDSQLLVLHQLLWLPAASVYLLLRGLP